MMSGAAPQRVTSAQPCRAVWGMELVRLQSGSALGQWSWSIDPPASISSRLFLGALLSDRTAKWAPAASGRPSKE